MSEESSLFPLGLPDREQPEFFARLLWFGQFIEENCRRNCQFDLNNWPNPVWQALARKLFLGLEDFSKTKPEPGQVVILQWYNSGILVKTPEQVLGFDLVPIPRYYCWPDEMGLTGLLAEVIDVLFVTHNHADHFDSELIKECNRLNRPVFMHPQAVPAHLSEIGKLPDQTSIRIGQTRVKAHHGRHVWRSLAEEVATSGFEVELAGGFRFVFCGDLDYTVGLTNVTAEPDVLFITWRNPGPAFEDGHPEQRGNTVDAVNIAIEQVKPRMIVLEHYAELDHVYHGFSASYELALQLIRSLPVKTEILFWGDKLALS